ncbi:MAG: ATP-grasp domain-containing protein [Bacteriovoracaceae bacterium]
MEEAAKLSHNVALLNPLTSVMPLHHLSELWPRFDIILHRITGARLDDFDLRAVESLSHPGVQVINSLSSLESHRDKVRQFLYFKRFNIPFVPTIIFRGMPKRETLDLSIDELGTDTYVLKLEKGNQGHGVNLVHTREALYSLLETFHLVGVHNVMIQPYIRDKKEYRVYFVKGEVVGIMERICKAGGFKANFAQESTARLLKAISPEIEKIVEKTIQVCGLFYGSIDLLESEAGVYLLEVNSVTGFEQFELVSGLNFAQLVLSRISK